MLSVTPLHGSGSISQDRTHRRRTIRRKEHVEMNSINGDRSIPVEPQEHAEYNPSFLSKVSIQGHDGAYLVYRVDSNRRVADLLPFKNGQLELDVPFASMKPLENAPF
jgi:hypothetical protein